MMSMLVFAIIGVGLNQLVRVVRQGTTPKAAFALATLVAPVLLVTLISAVRAITTTLQQLQSKHPPED